MSSHADTIRDAREWAERFKDNDLSWYEHGDEFRDGAELMLTLLAENQRLRDALKRARPYVEWVAGEAVDPADVLQAEQLLDDITALDGTPSAAQTLEDATPDKEKAGS